MDQAWYSEVLLSRSNISCQRKATSGNIRRENGLQESVNISFGQACGTVFHRAANVILPEVSTEGRFPE